MPKSFVVWLTPKSSSEVVTKACVIAKMLADKGLVPLLPVHLPASMEIMKALGGRGFLVTYAKESARPGVITASTYANPRRQAMKVNPGLALLSKERKALLLLQVALLTSFDEPFICIHDGGSMEKVCSKLKIRNKIL